LCIGHDVSPFQLTHACFNIGTTLFSKLPHCLSHTCGNKAQGAYAIVLALPVGACSEYFGYTKINALVFLEAIFNIDVLAVLHLELKSLKI